MCAALNCPVVSRNMLSGRSYNCCLLLDGYHAGQMKINGQFSYERSSQRELQFSTDIREINLSRRVWQGEESEFEFRGS